MATLAFQAIGTSIIGGPVGGMIGAVIGGVIDQALFGPGDQEGPRVNDLRVTTSTYGTAIPIVYGPENRITGNIIWSSDLIETTTETGGKGGPSFTEFSYRVSCAVAFSRRPVTNLKRIWANGKVIYDADAVLDFSPNHPLPSVDPTNGQIVTKYFLDETVSPEENVFRGTHALMDEIRFYPGNMTQIADTLIESFEGVGNAPAYRNTSYVVIKDLELSDFGNRMPNFEFELEADTSITVAEVVQDLTLRANITNSSVFHLDDNVRGYILGRQVPVFRAVLPLGVTFDFETTEQRGQIRYVKKSRSMKGSVELTSMGAHEPSNSPAQKSPIAYRNITEVSMPDEVSVTYKDPAMDYQINTQTAFRRKGNAINKISQELPVVIDADKARQVADRLLWGAWSNKTGAEFQLNDEWVRINPGDLLGIPAFDETIPMKVLRTTRGNNGIIQFEATYEDPELYNSQAIGVAGPASNKSVEVPGETLFVPMDAPLLKDSDEPTGFYWGATGANSGWRGATIKRSSDGGTTFTKMSDISIRSPIGNVTGTLGDGQAVMFDRTNTLTVTLTSASSTLESISELLVLNGNNAAWVGPAGGGIGEIIQFATATLVSAKTYDLTNILRGRLGTEHAMDSHSAGEVFVMLKFGALGTSEFSVNDWDKERSYKAISFLTDELLTDAQTFTNTGVRSKPLAPVHVEGSRNGSDDLTITWLRRSRLKAPGFGSGDAPLGETTEAYEVDILDGATVVRTIEITSETASYTAAEQTTDGLTPGDFVVVDVFQISSTRGRGYAARATI